MAIAERRKTYHSHLLYLSADALTANRRSFLHRVDNAEDAPEEQCAYERAVSPIHGDQPSTESDEDDQSES